MHVTVRVLPNLIMFSTVGPSPLTDDSLSKFTIARDIRE